MARLASTASTCRTRAGSPTCSRRSSRPPPRTTSPATSSIGSQLQLPRSFGSCGPRGRRTWRGLAPAARSTPSSGRPWTCWASAPRPRPSSRSGRTAAQSDAEDGSSS
eukprot:6115523-Pyramimonas_sp.AAC.1